MNTERIEEAIQKIKSFKQGESAAHIDKQQRLAIEDRDGKICRDKLQRITKE